MSEIPDYHRRSSMIATSLTLVALYGICCALLAVGVKLSVMRFLAHK